MSRPHCPRCTRPLPHCLCALIPSLPSRSRVLILQHPSEVRHALNTARLAALGLCNSELLIGELFTDLDAHLRRSDYQSYLLFPGEQTLSLADLAAQVKRPNQLPIQLVVPDGTWRKARKLLHLNPALAALPRVVLPAGLVSRYRLRKAPEEGALATIEAIVTALEQLEPATDFAPLLKPFEALIEGQISAMGADTFARNHGR